MNDAGRINYVLPRRLLNRLSSIGSYVRSVVNEEEEGTPRRHRLTRQEVETIAQVLFACLLNQFFKDGSRAARSAVDEFKRHGVDEFLIGATVFAGRNENVMRGDNLSKLLLMSVGKFPILELLQEPIKPREMVLELMNRVKHGRPVD